MASRARRLLRALRWVFVCALLAVSTRAPVLERVTDTIVLAAATRAAAAPSAPVRASAPDRDCGARPLPERTASLATPDAPRPAASPRLYLRHRSLLL
ncbi:MAG: hypothetical protein IT373_29895 [Polyangiaceae bacterium]|nr:hypothetical protein [Polyangiaceae bacterium]